MLASPLSFRLQASPLQHARDRRVTTPPSRSSRGHVLQVRAGLQDPWTTLGVPHSASEKEIKKAHRQLVKQHHPDVRSNDPQAHARFISIQEAYELVMGKRAGKDIDSRPANQSGWSFHDWYWSFGMRRRAKAGAASSSAGTAGAAEAPPAPAPREQWEAQMAGLKQKAAAKRGGASRRRRVDGADAAFDAAGAEAAAFSASPAAGSAAAAKAEKEQRESVWRSMTKNARNSDKAAAAAAAAAGAQTLGSTAAAAPSVAVGAGSRASPLETPMPAASAAAAAPEPQPPLHHAAVHATDEQLHSMHSSGAEEAAATHTPPYHHTSNPASHAPTTHAQRLQQLMSRAAGLVHDARRGAEGAAHAHSQRLGAHLRSPPTFEQLATLLGGRHSGREHERSSGGTWGNAVAANAQLHHRFEASRRRMAERQHAAAAAPHAAAPQHGDVASAAAAAGQQAEQQHATSVQLQAQQGQVQPEGQQVQERYSSSAGAHHTASQARHARKFANRDEVEGRLNTQLAGLKRRAAIKHEVESSC